jgi:hypothetical protein
MMRLIGVDHEFKSMVLETYHVEGEDAARIGEQVVVTKDGCRRIITKFPSQKQMSCWNT